jgi:hypothetical protein
MLHSPQLFQASPAFAFVFTVAGSLCVGFVPAVAGSLYVAFLLSLTPLINIHSRISPRIFEKIRNGPNGILRGPGDTDL